MAPLSIFSPYSAGRRVDFSDPTVTCIYGSESPLQLVVFGIIAHEMSDVCSVAPQIPAPQARGIAQSLRRGVFDPRTNFLSFEQSAQKSSVLVFEQVTIGSAIATMTSC